MRDTFCLFVCLFVCELTTDGRTDGESSIMHDAGWMMAAWLDDC